MERNTPITGKRRRTGFAAPLLAALGLNACFAYTPVETHVVRPEEQVRIVVSRDAAARLAQNFGAVAPQLEGQLRPMGGDSLAFAMWVGSAYTGTEFGSAYQTLPLARSDIQQVYRRQFSAKRTTLFALGVTAAVAILVNRLTAGERNLPDGPIEPPPPPPLEIIRIRW
jgi:hypothetical protein